METVPMLVSTELHLLAVYVSIRVESENVHCSSVGDTSEPAPQDVRCLILRPCRGFRTHRFGKLRKAAFWERTSRRLLVDAKTGTRDGRKPLAA